MRIRESTSVEISTYLKSVDLYNKIKDLTDDSYDACREVFNICSDLFQNIVLPKIVRVQIINLGEDTEYDILESDYYVIEYNGRFYDYCAYTYFKNLGLFNISEYDMPVIQPILTVPSLIHSTVSTIKNYVIKKY